MHTPDPAIALTTLEAQVAHLARLIERYRQVNRLSNARRHHEPADLTTFVRCLVAIAHLEHACRLPTLQLVSLGRRAPGDGRSVEIAVSSRAPALDWFALRASDQAPDGDDATFACTAAFPDPGDPAIARLESMRWYLATTPRADGGLVVHLDARALAAWVDVQGAFAPDLATQEPSGLAPSLGGEPGDPLPPATPSRPSRAAPGAAPPLTAWCLVANVDRATVPGPDGSPRAGTRCFRAGAKVYCLPPAADTDEVLTAIGHHRKSVRLVREEVPVARLTNWRVEGVYAPRILFELGPCQCGWCWRLDEAHPSNFPWTRARARALAAALAAKADRR